VKSNVVTICGGHHRAVHEGLLVITGVAPDRLMFEFRRVGEDAPHLVMRSAPRNLDAVVVEVPSVPRGTERDPVHGVATLRSVTSD
jgi:hypothetical protein